VDIAAFVKNEQLQINWKRAFKKLNQNKIDKAAVIGFYLANQLIGTSLPVAAKQNINQSTSQFINHLLTFPLKSKNKLSIHSFRQRLLLKNTVAGKMKLALHYLLYRPIFIIRSYLSLSSGE
jgi:hypothetical protein